MHPVSVAELYFPVAHAIQAVLAACPVFVWLVPAPHVMHCDSALFSGETAMMYFPAAQATQSVTAELVGDTLVVNVPTGHTMQPTSSTPLHLPAGQEMQ
jgi:hypothetical protein